MSYNISNIISLREPLQIQTLQNIKYLKWINELHSDSGHTSTTNCKVIHAWRWHNSYQIGVTGITDKLIPHYGKKLRGVQEEQQPAKKHYPDTTLTSLLRQPSTITYCDRFSRICVNTGNTEPPISTEQTSSKISRVN